MEKDNKNKINYKNLNELIKTGRVILKMILILSICSLVIFGFYVLEKTNILNIIGKILGIISPLFIGLIFAWLFKPLVNKLKERNLNDVLATSIVYICFVLVVLLLLILVVPEFISQLKELALNAPRFLASITDWIKDLFSNFDGSEIDITTLQNNILSTVEGVVDNLTTNSLDGILSGITAFLSEGFNFILGILIGFYFSKDFKKVSSTLGQFIPKKYSKDINYLAIEFDNMARGYVSGTLFTSLIVAFLTFIGLLISGVSSPLLFAIFCGITNIIPYFGPYIGGIPVIVVGFSISPICGFICLITIVLVQFVEGNIIHPLVVGKATDVHPVTIIIGLLVFDYFFGIIGMIIAAPCMGAVKILFNFFDNKYHFMNKIKINKEA